MKPNHRQGTSPHRGGRVIDGKSEAAGSIGINVSKAWVDMHIRPEGTGCCCMNDSDGVAEPVGRLTPLRPRLIVPDDSGGYERVVAAVLAEAALPVKIVNPRQMRQFADAIGWLPKTDGIDAAVIAHFAQAERPAARPLPDDLSVRLVELMARRRQVVVMINPAKQRLSRTHDRIAPSSLRALLKRLQADRVRIDKAIDKLVEVSSADAPNRICRHACPASSMLSPAP